MSDKKARVWRGMRVYGVMFPSSEQREAWESWNPATGSRGLEKAIENAHGQIFLEIRMRAADRMLQTARKHGMAEYRERAWRKIDRSETS